MKTAHASLLILAVATVTGFGAPAASRPNIVFILADDYGIDGVGCYGSDRLKDKTPNIDALARSGARFTHCFAMPVCGPSRCTLMTGRYGFRTGATTNGKSGGPSPANEVGIAKVLQDAGYATAQAGKWRQMSATPRDWGFAEYLTDTEGGGWFWQDGYIKNGESMTSEKGAYQPDVMHAFALDFIRRKKDGPFFLYYASHLVHAPIQRTPDSKTTGRSDFYADDVSYLDKQVGEIVATLDELGLRENTLIVFSGDNGTNNGHSPIGGRRVNGEKKSLLEGGSRVPLIANWQGTTPAGTVLDDLIDFTDLFPTFAALGGARLPAGVNLDGRSFAPQLRGEKGAPRDWVFVQFADQWYARERGWKLTSTGALFDMADAPFVEKPVAADAPDEAASAARRRLQAVLAELNPAAGDTAKAGGESKKIGKKKRKGVSTSPSTPSVSAAVPATK